MPYNSCPGLPAVPRKVRPGLSLPAGGDRAISVESRAGRPVRGGCPGPGPGRRADRRRHRVPHRFRLLPRRLSLSLLLPLPCGLPGPGGGATGPRLPGGPGLPELLPAADAGAAAPERVPAPAPTPSLAPPPQSASYTPVAARQDDVEAALQQLASGDDRTRARRPCSSADCTPAGPWNR